MRRSKQVSTIPGGHGDQDLSYFWRGAWSKGKLYFLVEVTDDKLVDPSREAGH